MHSLNHFLTAFTINYALFANKTGLATILIWSLLFGVFVDLDIILSPFFGVRGTKVRTWFQEPFGLAIVGIPLALLSVWVFNTTLYAQLILYSWASHIVLDYFAVHTVRPWLPFSKKEYVVGIFSRIFENKNKKVQVRNTKHSFGACSLFGRQICVSEWWFTTGMFLVFVVVLYAKLIL